MVRRLLPCDISFGIDIFCSVSTSLRREEKNKKKLDDDDQLYYVTVLFVTLILVRSCTIFHTQPFSLEKTAAAVSFVMIVVVIDNDEEDQIEIKR